MSFLSQVYDLVQSESIENTGLESGKDQSRNFLIVSSNGHVIARVHSAGSKQWPESVRVRRPTVFGIFMRVFCKFS